jgi:hypothetical protein
MSMCRAPARLTRMLVGIGLACTSVGAATFARADEGRCLIRVDGRTFLKGACGIQIRPGGSFTVGVGEQSRSKYFAYVNIESASGVAQGYWNDRSGEDHAGADLGVLKRKGACWSNRRAKVCAWR